MSLILANIVGFIYTHWRIFAAVGAFLVLLLIIVGFRSCGKRAVKIDEQSIQKINRANESERKAELQKVIDENAGVIKTVDERSNIAETNRIERERLTDEKIAEVDRKILEAKKQGRDVSSNELECLLVPENCK